MGIAQKERDFETFKYSRSLVNTRLYLNSVKIEYESKKVIDYLILEFKDENNKTFYLITNDLITIDPKERLKEKSYYDIQIFSSSRDFRKFNVSIHDVEQKSDPIIFINVNLERESQDGNKRIELNQTEDNFKQLFKETPYRLKPTMTHTEYKQQKRDQFLENLLERSESNGRV